MDNDINAVANKNNEANRNINLNIVGDGDNDNSNIMDDSFFINDKYNDDKEPKDIILVINMKRKIIMKSIR